MNSLDGCAIQYESELSKDLWLVKKLNINLTMSLLANFSKYVAFKIFKSHYKCRFDLVKKTNMLLHLSSIMIISANLI